MKKLAMILSLVVTGILLAGGVALAANVRCEEPDPDSMAMYSCVGTKNADQITGTDEEDGINAKQGNDLVNGGLEEDLIVGGTGADRLFGNPGDDQMIAAAIKEGEDIEDIVFNDNSDDTVRGNAGDDTLYGGFGQGGLDQVFGDGGADQVIVTQRYFRAQGIETKITRETADCGPDEDTVYFDRGIDKIDRESCENLVPIDPDGQLPPPSNGRSTASLGLPF